MKAASRPSKVTELLRACHVGEQQALECFAAFFYKELRRITPSCRASERPDHTLQPTVLVDEAYLRMADARDVNWPSRAAIGNKCWPESGLRSKNC